MKEFTIEAMYQEYLEKIGLKEKDMHFEQKKQVKDTFYAACAMLWIVLRDEIASLTEEQAILFFDSLESQIISFCKSKE